MREKCSVCGTKFEREPGFFLGSIYINYGLTALLAAIAYIVLFMLRRTGGWETKAVLLTFVVLFPLLMHRHARSLWLGFDQWHDPRDGEKV